MATIKNRKREPLSEQEVIDFFNPHGIGIEECDDGVCLVFVLRSTYKDEVIRFDSGAANNERWWANLQGLLKGEFCSKDNHESERDRLADTVNAKLFGITSKYTVYF